MAKVENRPIVQLACTECKERTYTTEKSKRNDPSRIELKKSRYLIDALGGDGGFVKLVQDRKLVRKPVTVTVTRETLPAAPELWVFAYN